MKLPQRSLSPLRTYSGDKTALTSHHSLSTSFGLNNSLSPVESQLWKSQAYYAWISFDELDTLLGSRNTFLFDKCNL